MELSKKRQEKIARLEREIKEEEEAERRRKKILEEKTEAYQRMSNGQLLATGNFFIPGLLFRYCPVTFIILIGSFING